MNRKNTNKMKSFLRSLMLSLLILLPVTAISYGAEKIQDIEIYVQLKEDGSAYITQIWQTSTERGTEFYIPMSNMGDMALTNFQVQSADEGREFTYVENWDINASLSQKAYKYGINYLDDGSFELCWGKGSYGNHTYILSYTLTNMVKSYPDNDGFLVRFINDQMDPAPQHAKITIARADAEANASFIPEEVGVYGFGYSGYINVLDGEIIAETDQSMSSANHMTLMVRLPKGMLNPISIGSGTFADLEERAKLGSDYTPDHDDDYYDSYYDNNYYYEPGPSIFSFIGPIVALMSLFTFVFAGKSALNLAQATTPLASDYKKVAPRYKDLDYYRDLPLEDHLGATEYALINAGKAPKDEDLMGAYFLRLIKSGAFEIQKDIEVRTFRKDKESTSIRLMGPDKTRDGNELAFYDLIRQAAGGDGILQEKEMKKYAAKHYKKIDNWMAEIRRNGEANFGKQGGYTIEVQDKLFGSKQAKKITDKGVAMMNQTLGFKKFLEDFTLISEREAREVALWDGYLIYAALFGIADKVAKEMKRIYPDFEKVSDLTGRGNTDVLTTLYLTNSMNRAMTSGYSSGKYASQGGSRSSGGGGGASFGGGGGFSGGGSGGGSR